MVENKLRGVILLAKRLFLLLLITCLFISEAFMTGCAPKEYEVKVQADSQEAGEISGEGIYEEGEEVTVEVEPEEGYEFVKWEKDGEKVGSKEEYQFKITEDKLLEAIFYVEKLSEEVDGWQTSQEVVEIEDLEHLAVKENWEDTGEDSTLVSVGCNFLAIYNREEQEINLREKDSLEVVAQIEEVEQGNIEIDFLGKDYLLHRNIGNENPYIYHITHEGKEKVEELDIFTSGFNLPEEKSDRLSQIMSHPGLYLRADFSIIDDYVFIFPDYTRILEFEEPPRLKEPSLKLFQFQDDELVKVEDNLLEESLLTVDVVKYQDDTALLSTACHGLIQIDLTDFSTEKLNFGGNYNLAEDNRPFSNGHYQDYYVGHFFRGISSEGAILMRTQIPLPKCHGWKKHLVVPTDDGSFMIVGQSGVYSKGQIDDEELGSTFPYKLKGDFLVAGEHPQSERMKEFGGGIFALLELNNERALQAQDIDGSDLPGIGEYFDIKVNLKDILSEAGVDKLPSILAWEIEGKEKLSNYYRQDLEQENDKVDPLVFSRIKDDHIELRQIKEDVQVLDVDDNNKEIYVELEGDIYRLDYDSFFDS